MSCQTGFVESAEWMQKNVPDSKPLREYSTAELVELSRKAHAANAPTSIFNTIKEELAFRDAPNTPRPKTEYPTAKMTREQAAKKFGKPDPERSAAEVKIALEGPQIREAPKTFTQMALKRAQRFFHTQRHSWMQTTQGAWGGAVGEYGTWADVIYSLTDKAKRAALGTVIKDTGVLADAARSDVMRMTHLGLKDVENALSDYSRVLSDMGQGKTKEAIFREAYETYKQGEAQWSQHPSPEMRRALESTKKTMNELSSIVRANTKDADLIAKIDANMDKYLFRQYSIFDDPEAIYKNIDTTTDAYKAFREKLINTDRFLEEIYSQNRRGLEEAYPGLTEQGYQDMLDEIVERHVEGTASALVKKHLSTKTEKTGIRGAIGNIDKHYLKEKELYDESIRAMMGEKAHLPVAVLDLGAAVAHDVYVAKMRNGLYEGLKESGLISESGPMAGLDVQLNKKSILQPNAGFDDVADGVIYTTPEVRSTLQALDKANSGPGEAISKAIARVKLFKVLTPHNIFFNAVSSAQNAIMGAGLGRTIKTFLSGGMSREIAAAFEIGREIAFPGTVKGSIVKKSLSDLGFDSLESVRDAASDFVKYGGDVGGEYYAAGKEGIQPLFKNKGNLYEPGTKGAKAEGVITKAKELTKEGTKIVLESYRMPDVAAKVYVYRQVLDELKYKSGAKYITEDMKKEAVRMTLELSQDPRSTPDGIRNLSKGVVGLATGGFQGFHYQMGKTLVNSAKYGMRDLITASKLAAAGETAKAARYATAGADRIVTTVATGYAAFKAAEMLISKDPEKVEDIKHFMYPDRRNSTMMNLGVSKGLDGRSVLTTVNFGLMDAYDSSVQRVLLPFANGMAKGDPLGALKAVGPELRDILIGPGVMLQEATKLIGLRANSVLPPKFSKRSEYTTDGEYIKTPKNEYSLTGRRAWETTKGLAVPKAFQQVSDTTEGAYSYAKAAELGDKKGMQDAWERISKTWKIDVQDVDRMVAGRFSEDWKKASWISDARSEWKKAKNINDRARIIKTYEQQWNELYSNMLDTSHRAHNAFDLKSNDVYNYMVGKKGEDAPTSIPKGLAKNLALGRQVSFRRFLDE